MNINSSKQFAAIILGGIAAFGFFLMAAIIAAFMHDARAGELSPQVYPPGMGDRMLLLALPGENTDTSETGNL